MAFFRRIGLAVAVVLAAAGAVGAQPRPSPAPERSSSLGLFAGGASGSEHTGPALSGVAGWQLSRWVALEGRGSWLRREAGADACGADLGAIVNLVPSQQVTPFVGAAFGLYRVSFDSPADPASDFYRRRLAAPDGVAARNPTFTDPSLRISAGVDVVPRRNLTFRPEVSALLVWRDGRSQTLALFGVKIGYRFEERPVTP